MERQRPLPQEARSAAEFVACMRRLKEQAGLTYRQLEANAERRGDVLARSTVADALRRDSLPRAEVVAAFVRACGRGEDAAAWLEARGRLAAAEPSHAGAGSASVEAGSAYADERPAPRGEGGAPQAAEEPPYVGNRAAAEADGGRSLAEGRAPHADRGRSLAEGRASHANAGRSHAENRAHGDDGRSPANEGRSPTDERPTSDRSPEHPARSTAPRPAANASANPAVNPAANPVANPAAGPVADPAAHPSAPPPPGRVGNRRALAVTACAALLLAAVGAWALLPREDGDRDAAARAAGAAAPRLGSSTAPASATGGDGPAPGQSRIRPALAPKLCVTEGHDRKGRYRSQVAVQRPCADATPPDVSLVSVGNTGSYYIQWRHPVYGDGCLTALGSGHVVEGLLEPWPWESCSADRTSQHFYFEPVDGSNGPQGNGYRIHVVQNGMCLGVNGADDRAAGAEIAQQRCTGGRDQEFLVDAVD